MPDEATSPLLQLETGSRSRGYGRFHAEMGNQSRVCQSAVVPDTSLPHQSEKRSGKDSANNTSVENSTVVSTNIAAPGGLPLKDSSTTRSDINATFWSAPVDHLAYIRQSYTSQGISSQDSDIMLASWRQNQLQLWSSFSKWTNCCR